MENLIVANWKMNPLTYAEAEELTAAVLKLAPKLKRAEIVLCPPFLWLTDLSHKYAHKIEFGAQDVFWEDKGAYTGEIAPIMLKNLGVRYVIIGHSERRRHLHETDEMVNKKVCAALKYGLNVILCIGETLEEHKRGQTKSVLRRQLKSDLAGVSKFEIPRSIRQLAELRGRRNSKLSDYLVIAYEPVWSIGTGIPETPQNAAAVAKFIRQELSGIFSRRLSDSMRIIYGGSVNSKNIGGYLRMPQIAGALVGGASLGAKDFGKILKIANNA